MPCVRGMPIFEAFDTKMAIGSKSKKPETWKLPMTSDQFRIAIIKLELSQIAAARLLGVDGTTLRLWANGERDIPAPAVRFLHYLIASQTKGEHAVKILDSWVLVRQGINFAT